MCNSSTKSKGENGIRKKNNNSWGQVSVIKKSFFFLLAVCTVHPDVRSAKLKFQTVQQREELISFVSCYFPILMKENDLFLSEKKELSKTSRKKVRDNALIFPFFHVSQSLLTSIRYRTWLWCWYKERKKSKYGDSNYSNRDKKDIIQTQRTV